MKKTILLLITFVTLAFTTNKKFPDFSLPSYGGSTITNEDLIGKNTLIMMGHLECPPALKLMLDLDSMLQTIDTTEMQILVILENTQEHIENFYHDSTSIPGLLRIRMNIDTLRFPILTECPKEKSIAQKDGQIKIKNHCRKLARKVHTRSSPTLVLLNQQGQIMKVNKGYIMHASTEARLSWIDDFINQTTP